MPVEWKYLFEIGVSGHIKQMHPCNIDNGKKKTNILSYLSVKKI